MSAPNPLTAADAPLVENQYAWTKKSAVLFVEQPVRYLCSFFDNYSSHMRLSNWLVFLHSFRQHSCNTIPQKGGVGFSKASSEWTGQAANDRDEDDVASAFYAFLTNFYNVFGEEIAKKKLYITGESYGGW